MTGADVVFIVFVLGVLIVFLGTMVTVVKVAKEPPPKPYSYPVSIRENHGTKVAVSPDYFWNEDMQAAPLGCKLQLKTMGGVAVYGQVSQSNRSHFLAWAPLPLTKKDRK